MKLVIGNVELDNNVILAPMAGVTDLPYRVLCREQGCGLCCMEMVSAKAVLYRNRNTKAFCQKLPENWKKGHTISLTSTWAVLCPRS